MKNPPLWHPEEWQAEVGAGTVTAVTATPPLSSSGGATPDISHDDAALTPNTYGAIPWVIFQATFDQQGHVQGAVDRNMPWPQQYSIRVAALSTDAYFLGNPGQGQALTYTSDGPAYPAPWTLAHHRVKIWFDDATVTAGTTVTIKVVNVTALTEVTVGTIVSFSVPVLLSATVNLDFAIDDLLALEISHDGTTAAVIAAGTVVSY